MMKAPDIIDIPDDDALIPTEKAKDSESIPVIVIEREGEINRQGSPDNRGRKYLLLGVIFIALLCVSLFYFVFNNSDSDSPVSLSENEILELLEEPVSNGIMGIETFRDTILGVPLTFYPLDGLKASLEKQLPDTADTSLVAFFRSADYKPDGRAIGTLVMDGETAETSARESRQGYVAISQVGKPVIGIGASDKVQDYVIKNQGSFFQQYFLLADNTIPPKFELHGKVERAALGRMKDNKLYYVISANRETMWGFADALREYGIIDAVYITGGNKYDFSRDAEGNCHFGNKLREEYIEQRGKSLNAPMLVFRNR